MNQKGFTLIELLVVVAIIGILAAVGVVSFNSIVNKAKINACNSNHGAILNDLSSRIAWCNLGNEQYNYTKSDGSGGYIECNAAIWTQTGMYAEYFKEFYKNPLGERNGSWDGSTYFVDRNQIPDMCRYEDVGYSFLTSFDNPASFRLGTCCYEGEPAKTNTIYYEK